METVNDDVMSRITANFAANGFSNTSHVPLALPFTKSHKRIPH